jgi:phosphate transport system permease protein
MMDDLKAPVFVSTVHKRKRNEHGWKVFLTLTTSIGIIFLIVLLSNIINQSFGYVSIGYKVSPQELVGTNQPLETLSSPQLAEILRQRVSTGLLKQLEKEKPLAELSEPQLVNLIIEKVAKPEVVQTWTLWQSLIQKQEILQTASQKPDEKLVFYSWFRPRIVSTAQSSNPLTAGVRTALLGSLWIILIAILVSFPLGVGTAIYLEEYASESLLNRIIRTNINNLAGVPSIIYGMLGLAVFVRGLSQITSGAWLGLSGAETANGRTILSAGLTLALLVLPLIIINAREAIKAVPDALRQASYGIGATRWQTIWHHVLPNSIPGILTGSILAVSRALGESAPLVVIGASTYITMDPANIFSRFTALPIQIYQWTARPQPEFRNLAAGAILVLLALLLSINSIAILLRNRYKRY